MICAKIEVIWSNFDFKVLMDKLSHLHPSSTKPFNCFCLKKCESSHYTALYAEFFENHNFSFYLRFPFLKSEQGKKVSSGMAQWWEHLPPTNLMWPGFDYQTQCHMLVDHVFVVGYRHCSKGFSPGTMVFLSPQKPTFQITIRPGNSGRIATLDLWMCHWDSH